MFGSSFTPSQPGGVVPLCHAFRLVPFRIAGKDAGAGPWPVKLRHQGDRRCPDVWVGDSSLRSSQVVRGDGVPPVGPYQIDPDGQWPGWSWLVEYCDEAQEAMAPAAVDPRSGTVLVYDSGVVAAGAAVDSGAVDVRPFGSLMILLDNTVGAVSRILVIRALLDDGTVINSEQGPAATVNAASLLRGLRSWTPSPATVAAGWSAMGVPHQRERYTIAAAGAAAVRLVVYGRT